MPNRYGSARLYKGGQRATANWMTKSRYHQLHPPRFFCAPIMLKTSPGQSVRGGRSYPPWHAHVDLMASHTMTSLRAGAHGRPPAMSPLISIESMGLEGEARADGRIDHARVDIAVGEAMRHVRPHCTCIRVEALGEVIVERNRPSVEVSAARAAGDGRTAYKVRCSRVCELLFAVIGDRGGEFGGPRISGARPVHVQFLVCGAGGVIGRIAHGTQRVSADIVESGHQGDRGLHVDDVLEAAVYGHGERREHRGESVRGHGSVGGIVRDRAGNRVVR